MTETVNLSAFPACAQDIQQKSQSRTNSVFVGSAAFLARAVFAATTVSLHRRRCLRELGGAYVGQNDGMSAVAEMQSTASDARRLVLECGSADRHYWAEPWRYREPVAILVWRDLVVRYKQITIGAAWALVEPPLAMIVLSLIFSRIAGLLADGATPYPMLVFAGMIAWFLFSTVLNEASNSPASNARLVAKIDFPRLIMPVETNGVRVIDGRDVSCRD